MKRTNIGQGQWQIKDFPDGSAPAPKVGAPACHLENFFPENENERNWTRRDPVPGVLLGYANEGPGPRLR